MAELNIDTFGEITDEFLEKTHVMLLLESEEGTRRFTCRDNIRAGSVLKFYALLQAFETVAKEMYADIDKIGGLNKEKFVNDILDLLRKGLLNKDE